MNLDLPPGAPTNAAEAFAYLDRLQTGASIDDLKILALVEVLGLPLYEAMAATTDNAEAKALLLQSGEDEMTHGRRVAQAIEILTGKPFPLPSVAEHPFYVPMQMPPISKAQLDGIIAGEINGGAMYKSVADSFDNEAARALFAQNGAEELMHAERLKEVSRLLFS